MHIMEKLSLIFGIWAWHALFGFALSAPILFLGRKRIGWSRWLLLAFIIPFCVWLGLMLSPLANDRKSLSNLGEPVYISFTMPLLALVRVALGKKVPERLYAITLLTVLSALAAALFFFVPMKPE